MKTRLNEKTKTGTITLDKKELNALYFIINRSLISYKKEINGNYEGHPLLDNYNFSNRLLVNVYDLERKLKQEVK